MFTKDKTLSEIATRSLCYLIPISMINWAMHFKMAALSYAKTIYQLFQIWKN